MIERLGALENAVELVAKATPGPWAQEHRRGSDSSYRTEVFDEHGEAIATLTWHPKPPIYEGGMKGTSTDRAENAEAIVAAVNFIREHGSALIAELGQEVGAVDPVAMRVVLPRGSTSGWESYDAERAANLSRGWTVELAYSSPAHTSEARDAALRLLYSKDLYGMLMDVQNGIDSPASAGIANSLIRRIDASRDAAMRQEGE